MKKYKFKNLNNIQNFVLKVLQLMIDTINTDFNIVVEKIDNYVFSWNITYCNNFINPQCKIKDFSKDISGNACKFSINIFDKNIDFILNVYYSKDNWRPLYSIQLFDSDHLLMAQFTEKSLNNPRYLNNLPTLEQEVAYDIYATYCNYDENRELIDFQHLEMYPKYVKKSFNNSALLKDIIKHLQQLDCPQMFINYCKTVLTK